jgi:hypothetical protein
MELPLVCGRGDRKSGVIPSLYRIAGNGLIAKEAEDLWVLL